MTTIIVTHEDNEVDEFEFESGHEIISIGRRSDNDVSIPNLSISGSHAKICLEGDQAFLEDLNSTNGTYVNGEVVKRRAIYNGDDIILGKIRLAAVLPIIASAEIASESRVDAPDSSSEDDFMGVSSNKMSGTPDSDDMSFDEDARLFAQSSSEPETAIEQSSDDDVQAAEFSDNPEPDNGFDDDLDNALKSSFASERFGSQDHDDDAPMIADFDTDNEPHPLDGIDSKLLGGHADDEPLSHELDSPSATSKGAVIEIKMVQNLVRYFLSTSRLQR